MPTIETEIAAAIKEGISQTINWKLCKLYQMSVEQDYNGGWDSQNREEGINVDGVNGSNL